MLSRQRPGRWIVRVAGDMRRSYGLQASLATLRGAAGAPCRVRVDGDRQSRRRWEFHRATEVLRLTLRGRTPRLVVEWRC